MDLNVGYGYHMGEDWNGNCGGDTDAGYPLFAIADGKVSWKDDVNNSAGGYKLYIRYSFPYAHGSNGVQTWDSGYFHLNGFASGIGNGVTVYPGQEVAYLGGTGGWPAHLHWEGQWDSSVSLTENSYKNPLTVSEALKYRAPSLVVDDRRDEIVYSAATGGYYTIFTMTGNATSSTAYIEWNNERKSLKKAIEAGWMDVHHLLYENGGSWYYYYDIDNNFFENGRQYAVSSNVSGSTLHIPVPRNNYQDDRARLDMIRAVENDPRFAEVNVNTYGKEAPWSVDSAWDIHWMQFKFSDGRTAYVNQLTNRSNPLMRNTAYYDPDLGQWTSWQWLDWNQLY